ncbi:hypothetical protein D3H55_21385 [Bacillus salacetis]|uniref:HAD family hydrolase n=1 Tax=Bacillus salacetis TaxID=2315464 RepID=A0A3A1QNH8_9BACI|nr:hypothetical protein [Bacillus salacetis]RIW28618.1 hypothetical protein D3H55_21385 [Bacillus salacetis]
MNKQTVIFDCDRTLFQMDDVFASSLIKTFECLNKVNEWEGDIPWNRYHHNKDLPLAEMWQELLPFHEKWLQDKASRLFQVHLLMEIRTGKGRLYPDAGPFLDRLSKECDFYIASNGLNFCLLELVNRFNIHSCIKGIFSMEECVVPRKETLIGDESNFPAAVVVGCRSACIQEGKDNDLYTIGCSWGTLSEVELDEADTVIHSFKELERILAWKGIYQ